MCHDCCLPNTYYLGRFRADILVLLGLQQHWNWQCLIQPIDTLTEYQPVVLRMPVREYVARGPTLRAMTLTLTLTLTAV